MVTTYEACDKSLELLTGECSKCKRCSLEIGEYLLMAITLEFVKRAWFKLGVRLQTRILSGSKFSNQYTKYQIGLAIDIGKGKSS
jgi:hypothetical protein